MTLHATSAEGDLLAFHDAFAGSIIFGIVGLLFALRIHDAHAAVTLWPSARVEAPRPARAGRR